MAKKPADASPPAASPPVSPPTGNEIVSGAESAASSSAPPLFDPASAVSSSLDSAPKVNEAAVAAQKARDAEEAKEKETRGVKPGTKRGAYNRAKKGAPGLQLVDPKAEQVKAWRTMGYQIADTLITAGITLGGEDWHPVKQVNSADGAVLYDERHNLREAWADLAEYYQWDKFPAWLAVSIATSSYVVPRLFAASTQTRWQKLKAKLAAWKAMKKTESEIK